MEKVRTIFFSDEFEEFYTNSDVRLKEKFNYLLNIVSTQYVVSQKFIKSLENTPFYELRISLGNNEYRTILFAIDHDNSMQCHKVILLNTFLKKSTKQYKAEIKIAENILNRYI